jgi:hypothetical protein
MVFSSAALGLGGTGSLQENRTPNVLMIANFLSIVLYPPRIEIDPALLYQSIARGGPNQIFRTERLLQE